MEVRDGKERGCFFGVGVTGGGVGLRLIGVRWVMGLREE